MSENFKIEIISPDQSILSLETTEVTIPCYEGLMTILKDHIPLVTFLRPGFIKVKNKENNVIFFAEEGTVEFFDNTLLILTTSTRDIKKIDNKEVLEMIENTEKQIADNKIADKEKYILSYKLSSLKELNQ
jgi:F-type H+-transporting ATPase subunit epsilon|tara:strand:+ start:217 stop:609 length:393 start_codon:yes stop_codon:yes gene_type:complete